MAGAGAGLEQGPGDPEAPGVAPEDLRDWAGLPEDLLVKVAAKVVAQNEAGWAAQQKRNGYSEEVIQEEMAARKREGNCLFIFARVCKGWRKTQFKVGGRLRTRVVSDVILPGAWRWQSGRWRRGAPGRVSLVTPWLRPLPGTDTSNSWSGCAGTS